MNIGEALRSFGGLQVKMESAQNRLAVLRIDGHSDDGYVTITMNGRHETLKVAIASELLIGGDATQVERSVGQALERAGKSAREAQSSELSNLFGGLPIPGFKLPF